MLQHYCRPLLQRVLSSAPAVGVAALQRFSSSAGDTVTLGNGGETTLLLSLPNRAWGAAAELPSSVVASIAGSQAGKTIAVVRQPFSPFDAAPRPLSKIVKCLGNNAVAVASEVGSPDSRVVVDVYKQSASGAYVLQSMATDLLKYLRFQGTRVCLVPDVNSAHKSNAARGGGLKQSTNQVLMVAPTAFGFNDEAAQDNSFMHAAEKAGAGSALTRQVLKEFSELYHQLTDVAGVKVNLFEHDLGHGTPDACFPNNWFSTHPKGEGAGGVKESTLVLYPMKCPNRGRERRPEIIQVLQQLGYGRVLDMTPAEQQKKYFEGTGVLVLDRINGVAYVDISERADASLAANWAEQMGYKELVTFHSTDKRGKSVYHTNVMMAVGTDVAVVCADSVADAKERQHLLSRLRATHEVVEISLDQMDALCGNGLELEDGRGLPIFACSTQAYNAFTPDQRKTLLRHCASIVHAPIDTLEKVGGGGVRCTLAELF